MQIFNIGPLELLLIIVLALVILGPERSIESLRKFGLTLRNFVRSSFWTETSREIRNMPGELMRETGLREALVDIRDSKSEISRSLQEVKLAVTEGSAEVYNAAKEINNESSDAVKEINNESSDAVKEINNESSDAVKEINKESSDAVEEISSVPSPEEKTNN